MIIFTLPDYSAAILWLLILVTPVNSIDDDGGLLIIPASIVMTIDLTLCDYYPIQPRGFIGRINVIGNIWREDGWPVTLWYIQYQLTM